MILFCIRKLGWRLGLQAVTGVLVLAFFLSAVYRSASLYHPQRRAILHLKNQRRKVRPVRLQLSTLFNQLTDLNLRQIYFPAICAQRKLTLIYVTNI